MKKAIVLLSGGLDSATTLYLARKQGYKCFCLSFDYGQRHKKEIESAKKIAQAAKSPLQVIKIRLPWKGSSLLDKNLIIPQLKDSRNQGLKGSIPSTYVPARNIIFLSFALSFAEAMGAERIFMGEIVRMTFDFPYRRLKQNHYEFLDALNNTARQFFKEVYAIDKEKKYSDLIELMGK